VTANRLLLADSCRGDSRDETSCAIQSRRAIGPADAAGSTRHVDRATSCALPPRSIRRAADYLQRAGWSRVRSERQAGNLRQLPAGKPAAEPCV